MDGIVKPITPKEAESLSETSKPGIVYEVFNDLIVKYWNGDGSTVPQKEAVDEIAIKMGIERESVFERHYLDIEADYRKAGWKVYYDKPGYNEIPYDPLFVFSKEDA